MTKWITWKEGGKRTSQRKTFTTLKTPPSIQQININTTSPSERLYKLINQQTWNDNNQIRLPPQMFHLTDYHLLECNHYLRQRYLFACLEGSLTSNGSHFTLEIGNTSVIVIRGQDTIIRALFNKCSHMNARICPRESDISCTDKLRCPLHHWTFACSGDLIAPRTAMTRTEEQRRHFALRQAPLINSNGMLFVKASHTDLCDDLPSVTNIHGVYTNGQCTSWPKEFDLHRYRLVFKQREVVAADWKLICPQVSVPNHQYQHMHTVLAIGPSFCATMNADKSFVVIDQILPVSAGTTSITRYHLVLACAGTDNVTINSKIALFEECRHQYERIRQNAQIAQQQLLDSATPVAVSPLLSDMLCTLQTELVKDMEREQTFRAEQEAQEAQLSLMNRSTSSETLSR